jgi:mannan endo-1,4-beta-mannosidase
MTKTNLWAALALLGLTTALPAAAQVNPAANQRTKNIYSYLKNLKNQGQNNRVLLGQHGNDGDGAWLTNWNYLFWDLRTKFSPQKELGFVGVDFGEEDRWKAAGSLDYFAGYGCIVTASWHASNPWTGGNYRDRTNGNLKTLLPNGANRTKWLQELDKIAEVLLWLQSKGRTVLWRPLHEMNGDWFWWCQRNAADYKALWQDMYNYFTKTKKLNNLLWVYAPNNRSWSGISTYDAYYPGASFVDVVGVDIYDDVSPTNALDIGEYTNLKNLAPTKPLICSELGPERSDGMVYWWDYAEKLRVNYPEIVAALAWHDWKNGDGTWSYKSIRGNKYDGALNNSVIITKEELPGF